LEGEMKGKGLEGPELRRGVEGEGRGG